MHPEVLAAMVAANGGHQSAYGADVYTAHLQEIMRGHFGERAQTYPVFNGTGANVLALQAVSERWGAVLCTSTAHINVDEGGAPERTGGLKLICIDTPDGKLTPTLIDSVALRADDEHAAQVGVVSITQSTELGTCYTVAEIAAIVEHAHADGLVVHVDGSRLPNAAASLGVSLREMILDTGVDILSLGGTKSGAMLAEAVVVLNPDAVRGVKFLRKQAMQLASKMRFVSAQLNALYGTDLFLRNATHANAMAARLAEGIKDLPAIALTRPVQANAVFPILPKSAAERLRQQFPFYYWDEAVGEARWMCSFDTTEADVDAFVAAIRDELA
ncbi:threonine aldolase family protein [Dermacoccaceae bacterium W4C1]